VKRLGDEHSEFLALKICFSGIKGDFKNVPRLENEIACAV
jgi:hypothetical protein